MRYVDRRVREDCLGGSRIAPGDGGAGPAAVEQATATDRRACRHSRSRPLAGDGDRECEVGCLLRIGGVYPAVAPRKLWHRRGGGDVVRQTGAALGQGKYRGGHSEQRRGTYGVGYAGWNASPAATLACHARAGAGGYGNACAGMLSTALQYARKCQDHRSIIRRRGTKETLIQRTIQGPSKNSG